MLGKKPKGVKPTEERIKSIQARAGKISKILHSTKEVEARINAAIARSCTLVLGDHKNLNLLKKVSESMEKARIPSFWAKIDGSNVNDILKSKLFMKDSDFIVMIDGRGAGTVGESHYAISNEKIASKLHLFVHSSNEKDVWDYKKHYVFFPRFGFWDSEKSLLESAAKVAEKEIRRLAYLEIVRETQCWGCPKYA
ncbi:MAG: hypothetical protein V1676_00280 [Candidatus Diapherotrites archaeon]